MGASERQVIAAECWQRSALHLTSIFGVAPDFANGWKAFDAQTWVCCSKIAEAEAQTCVCVMHVCSLLSLHDTYCACTYLL